jgi:hypothetical protein
MKIKLFQKYLNEISIATWQYYFFNAGSSSVEKAEIKYILEVTINYLM